ncbi:MAG: hypothetical protein M5R36_06200 [Deltaproteobacteria bacterium]|nr:hypothetical protein [Deltaproteobacteria bacterium]
MTTAVNGLRDIASTAEEAGDLETALIAWRTIRSGMYASRWLVTPGKDLIETANGHIARLVAVRAENDAPGSGRQAHDEEMTILTREVGPKTGWSVLAVIAFFGWIAAVVLSSSARSARPTEFYRRPALLYGLAFVACFALWMLGLSRA